MKKRKGFVFVESLIVIVVLTASLLMLYSSYSSVLIKENARMYYNDSAYLYRTYYLTKFFKNFRLDLLTNNLSLTNSGGKNINILSGFDCHRNDIFANEEDNISFCESIFDTLHISNVYLTYNDLSFLQECGDNTSGVCEALLQVREPGAVYLKTIGGKGKTGYRIIVEYSENKDGTLCNEEACVGADCSCKYHYTTLSLGDL